MPVRMAMPDAWRDRHCMFVPMVFVVNVFVIVHCLFMGMLVFMAFGQMQPCAERHQATGGEQLRRDRFSHQHGHQGAEERRDREVSSGAGGAEMAQADHE